MELLTDSQRKVVGAGITILALAVVLLFVSLLVFVVLRLLSFTSTAIVPVILGFFLSLFFKPYYLWWLKIVRKPNAALLLMLATVLIPLGFFLWYAGAIIIDQVQDVIVQGPKLMHQGVQWLTMKVPGLSKLLTSMGIPYNDVGQIFNRYGSTAVVAFAGILKTLKGIFSVLVSIIFFSIFITAL